ncbi:MAG: DUF6069 family protein [Tepidiformaceae bacterium]
MQRMFARRNRRLNTIGVLFVAVLAAVFVWSAFRLLGVDIEANQNGDVSDVEPAAVAFAALIGGLLAWAVHAFLASRGLLRWWPLVGSTALAISIIGPSYLADGESAMALITMHLVVGAVLIGGFSWLDAG